MTKLLSIAAVAAICHVANRAYCQEIGDNSQPKWENAPAWQKESAINGVKFHVENPGASPSASHENWLKEKVEAGWVYGEKKDPEVKTHPCCVPYDQLPKEQQAKDYLFKGIVSSLVPMIDMDALDAEFNLNSTSQEDDEDKAKPQPNGDGEPVADEAKGVEVNGVKAG